MGVELVSRELLSPGGSFVILPLDQYDIRLPLCLDKIHMHYLGLFVDRMLARRYHIGIGESPELVAYRRLLVAASDGLFLFQFGDGRRGRRAVLVVDFVGRSVRAVRWRVVTYCSVELKI